MLETEELKFYLLLSDTTFKYLFKNNNTRPILEKMIYKITGINLNDYRLDLLFEKDIYHYLKQSLMKS